jgi:hypothetical protein
MAPEPRTPKFLAVTRFWARSAAAVLGLLGFIGLVAHSLESVTGAIYLVTTTLSLIAIIVQCFFLLPLGFVPRTRFWAGYGLVLASYVAWLGLWFWSFILAFRLGGWLLWLIGMLIFGVGVIPMAFVVALIHAEWGVAIQLVILTVAVYGFRVLGTNRMIKHEIATLMKPYEMTLDTPPPPPQMSEPDPVYVTGSDASQSLLSFYDDTGSENYEEADLCFEEGLNLGLDDDWMAAIEKFKEAIRLDPLHNGAHYNLGIAYSVTGNAGAALREYQTLQSGDPKLASDLFEQIYA